jgi:hypothetical protein
MIAICANPTCNPFSRYSPRGEDFLARCDEVPSGSKTNPAQRRIEYFWLCGDVARA